MIYSSTTKPVSSIWEDSNFFTIKMLRGQSSSHHGRRRHHTCLHQALHGSHSWHTHSNRTNWFPAQQERNTGIMGSFYWGQHAPILLMCRMYEGILLWKSATVTLSAKRVCNHDSNHRRSSVIYNLQCWKVALRVRLSGTWGLTMFPHLTGENTFTWTVFVLACVDGRALQFDGTGCWIIALPLLNTGFQPVGEVHHGPARCDSIRTCKWIKLVCLCTSDHLSSIHF